MFSNQIVILFTFSSLKPNLATIPLDIVNICNSKVHISKSALSENLKINYRLIYFMICDYWLLVYIFLFF